MIMISYKRLVFLMISFLIILFSFHVTVWNIYTKHIFSNAYDVGDLGRLSYSVNSLSPRIQAIKLQQEHIEFNQWNQNKIDILTLGDSFSNGGAGGLNPFYQDYMATHYHKTVMNLPVLDKKANYLEMVYLLQNSGLLDQIKPKAILIESTERELFDRFSINTIDTTKTLEIKQLEKLLRDTKPDAYKPTEKVSFLNNVNINALQYNLFYHYDDNAFFSSCYQTQLKQKMFSSKNNTTLLFHKTTLPYNKSISNEKIRLLNKNLNDLALFLKSKGITLYFMPAVDKFNLYSKYIVKNDYGESTFFEQLRPMKKEYEFIDTKAILEREIDRKVMDVFYSDDTHWSYRASEAIVKSLSESKNKF